MSRLVPLLLTAVLACGCRAYVPGAPVAAPRADPSASLPFRPQILERTNDRNDGSSFEPCTAYSAADLRRLGIDPTTVGDAAFSDSPNFRGCEWTMPAAGVSQFVANLGSLAAYVEDHDEISWRPTELVVGRTIESGAAREGHCLAVFKSQGAVIITLASFWHADRWPQTACEWVVEFASLAAAKAP